MALLTVVAERLKRDLRIERAVDEPSEPADSADLLLQETIQVLEEYAPLPEPSQLRDAQKAIGEFIAAFDPKDHDPLAVEMPLRAGATWWNTELADTQPVLELTDDGFLEIAHQVRAESMRGRNGWLSLAWLELLTANALDPTQARIARAKTKLEARAIADELFDQYRGVIERRIMLDHRAGRTPTELASQYDLPRSTIRSMLDRHGESS